MAAGEPAIGGCWIPPEAMGDPELTMAQKVVFGRIRALAEDRGFCYAGNERLAQELGLSSRQVRRHIGSLASTGYLRRHLERDGRGVVTERQLYPLNPQASQHEDTSVPTPGDTSVPTPDERENGRTPSEAAESSPEDASVPTPVDREDVSVLQGGTHASSRGGRMRPVDSRGTAVKRESTTERAHARSENGDSGGEVSPGGRECPSCGQTTMMPEGLCPRCRRLTTQPEQDPDDGEPAMKLPDPDEVVLIGPDHPTSPRRQQLAAKEMA